MKKRYIVLSAIVLIIAILVGFYFLSLRPVSKDSKKVTFKVGSGISKVQIVDNLKTANLIRSKYAINGNVVLQAGDYELNENMSVKEIIDKIAKGDIIDKVKIEKLTLVEGQSIKDYMNQISKQFDMNFEEIDAKLKDPTYLQTLIDKYWFITDDILKTGIYYPLEGYIFPDTYQIPHNYKIEQIIEIFLDNMNKKLEPYKNAMENGKYTIHDYLTIASIIEKEGVRAEDRKTVSQVIYSRLNNNMNLGMDVTTYYSVQKKLTEGLTANDLNNPSPYNTRNAKTMAGKLPIGPIANPSLESIDATFNPSNTNYLYFYANLQTKEVYFASTYDEFLKYKNELGG